MDYIEGATLQHSIVMVAATPSNNTQTRAMGMCLVVDQTRKGVLGITTTDPTEDAAHYFHFYEKKNIGFLPFDSVQISKQPEHGKLVRGKDAGGREIYTYEANFGYVGKDRFEALVPVGNETLRLVYFLVVQGDQITDSDGFNSKKYCPKNDWKISSTTFDPLTQDYAAWLRSSELSSLIATASQTLAGFQDLTGSSVGQTTDEGATAQITLDTTEKRGQARINKLRRKDFDSPCPAAPAST